MLGFGWCHLRSDRQILAQATLDTINAVDEQIDLADEVLWRNYRNWMRQNEDPFLRWDLQESLNNHKGLLTYCVSRNHRSKTVWEMLKWIAKNGTGSYGLFYCNDDGDVMDIKNPTRSVPMDFDNLFRVHRVLNGSLTELPDPFFGIIAGGIDPAHPYDRNENQRWTILDSDGGGVF